MAAAEAASITGQCHNLTVFCSALRQCHVANAALHLLLRAGYQVLTGGIAVTCWTLVAVKGVGHQGWLPYTCWKPACC
jgi:hypothetical protein